MKTISAQLMIVVLHTSLFLSNLCAGQTSSGQSLPGAGKPASLAMIEGLVIKDPGGEPVKKALIELIAESQASGGNRTAVTGPDGIFHIDGVEPGRYRLFAERTGLLEASRSHTHSEGRLLTLTGGQELKDLEVRLQAAAVVSGRVTDEDGDPLQNAEVSLLRKTYSSGKARWEPAASERTNDLGEYRVAGLPTGSYYVSVNPPPDFRDLIEDSASAAPARSRNRAEKPTTSYQTTYYPGTSDRGQAAAIQLHPGDEFPMNFSLTPTPGLSIRGTVVNIPPRASAAIMLQSREFHLIFNGAEIHSDGSFVIRDVAPGAYTIVATIEHAAAPLMARQSLQIGSNSVEGLRLAPQAGGWIHGRLRLEASRLESAGHADPAQFALSLHSVDGDDDELSTFSLVDGFSPVAHVAPDGSFEWKNVPPGTYYVQLADGTADAGWFLKFVLLGGRQVEASGLPVEGGSVGLDVVASANGGVIEGISADKNGQPVGNAVVVAVPEAGLRSRLDRFHKTTTDQSGKFLLRGVAPGDYTLFAWDSLDGDAYYDPDFLKLYESQGIALHVSEADHKTIQLELIPSADSPP